MTKQDFLLTMQNALSGMHRADLEKTLQYYREMIEDRVEDGMSEEAAVADVGDPIELAEAIRGKPAARTAIRTAGAAGTPKPHGAPKARRPMSGGKKAALIVCAALLIVAGLGLILGSLHMQGDTEVKEYSFATPDFSDIMIDGGSATVQLLPASDGVCRVQCSEARGRQTIVGVTEGLLHIQRISKWSLFPLSLGEDFIRVYLPARSYESLWVKTSSGGVSVPADFRFRSAVVNASSGGIGFASEVTDELNVQTSSGGVAVSNASPDSLFVSASSGGVTVLGMSPGEATLRVSSGSLRLDGVRCGELSAESSSGSIRLSDVIAEGAITLGCTSGSIRLDGCDAAELHIECTSGSVTGRLLTPKIYEASATSGSVRVPESGSGGLCEVRTTSGSIRFE